MGNMSPPSKPSFVPKRVALAVALSLGTILFHAILCILLCYSILDFISPHPKINAGSFSSLKSNVPIPPNDVQVNPTPSTQAVNNTTTLEDRGANNITLPNLAQVSNSSLNRTTLKSENLTNASATVTQIPLVQSDDGLTTVTLNVQVAKPSNTTKRLNRTRTL